MPTFDRRAIAALAVLVGLLVGHRGWLPTATPQLWTTDRDVTEQATLPIAVSPWISLRLERGVLEEVEQIFNEAPGANLHVELRPTAGYLFSDVRMTGPGLQAARCGRTHGLALPATADDGHGPRLVAGRIWICGNAMDHGREHQVALLAHEVGHLLGYDHQGSCQHLMATEFQFDCPVDLSSLDDALARRYPR